MKNCMSVILHNAKIDKFPYRQNYQFLSRNFEII